MKPFVLTIIIPIYNEADLIAEVVGRVVNAVRDNIPNAVLELIAVDDGSTDGSSDRLGLLAQVGQLRYVTLPVNRGKGAAVARGLTLATGDIIVVQDADLEYDPADLPQLLSPLIEGRADAVCGTRFAMSHPLMTLRQRMLNGFLTRLARVAFSISLSDVECGYKAWTSSVNRGLRLTEERWGFDPEVIGQIAASRWRLREVAVSYARRDFEHGKKIRYRDAVGIAWVILRLGMARRRPRWRRLR
jgi:glycosyltransferase involved in cell wall biosynthesis